MKIIILLAINLMLIGCVSIGEQEVIVVPENFKGRILIVFSQKNGTPIKYLGEKRVYVIPRDGILKTQFATNDDWRGLPEYYYGKIAPEKKIPSFVELDKVPANTIVGFMGSTGTSKQNANAERLRFSEFYIGKKSDIMKAQDQADNSDDIMRSKNGAF